MLYNIISWDKSTGIARGHPAQIPEFDVCQLDIVDLYSTLPLRTAFTYSFTTRHRFVDDILAIGELDYLNPVPTGNKHV